MGEYGIKKTNLTVNNKLPFIKPNKATPAIDEARNVLYMKHLIIDKDILIPSYSNARGRLHDVTAFVVSHYLAIRKEFGCGGRTSSTVHNTI